MKIPPDAHIPRRKLTEYLLLRREVDDKAKFLGLVSFAVEDQPHELEATIRNWVSREEAIYDLNNEYGDFYRV